MLHQFSLARHQRLKSRKLIQQLFESGKSFSEFPFRITYLPSAAGTVQVGVSVSKRKFKKAVHRNRIKRLMREAWRLNAWPLREIVEKSGPGLSVFIVYNGNEIPEFRDTEEKIQRAIHRLIEKCNSKPVNK